MDASSTPVHELVPHGPEMTLIERLVSYDSARSVATARIDGDSVFFEDGGVPAWAGLEYMAQAIAAHAGFAARLRGERPAVGFLLGTRAYSSFVSQFPAGAQLSISVEPEATQAGFASFNCSIEIDRLVATAVVSVYRPSADELDRLRFPVSAR
jgi:predicted hotdog family 3-hydroxylacyl-ACP dehydratase